MSTCNCFDLWVVGDQESWGAVEILTDPPGVKSQEDFEDEGFDGESASLEHHEEWHKAGGLCVASSVENQDFAEMIVNCVNGVIKIAKQSGVHPLLLSRYFEKTGDFSADEIKKIQEIQQRHRH